MINIFCLFFTVAMFWFDLAKGHGRCTFEVPGLELRKMPLAYKINRSGTAFLIYPDLDRYFKVDRDFKIEFSCLTSTFNLPQLNGINEIEVTCLNGTTFIYNRRAYDYAEFICKDALRSLTKTSNQVCKHPNGDTVLNVGYQTQRYFFTVYSVCFDSTNMNTLYTWYKARVPYYDVCQTQGRIGFFREIVFGTLNFNTIYGVSQQIRTINSNFNLNLTSSRYVDQTSRYLTKGHLTSKLDFYLALEQNATFSYLNVSPQWCIANRLWDTIERTIRAQLIRFRTSKRVVVSGVYGSFTLPDGNHTQQVLYLTSSSQVSVPKFHWKLIYDADNVNNRVVYIGYNNPTYETPRHLRGQINCTLKQCPHTINIHPAIMLYCCDITSFQAAYGIFPDYVFDIQQGVLPSPAA